MRLTVLISPTPIPHLITTASATQSVNEILPPVAILPPLAVLLFRLFRSSSGLWATRHSTKCCRQPRGASRVGALGSCGTRCVRGVRCATGRQRAVACWRGNRCCRFAGWEFCGKLVTWIRCGRSIVGVEEAEGRKRRAVLTILQFAPFNNRSSGGCKLIVDMQDLYVTLLLVGVREWLDTRRTSRERCAGSCGKRERNPRSGTNRREVREVGSLRAILLAVTAEESIEQVTERRCCGR